MSLFRHGQKRSMTGGNRWFVWLSEFVPRAGSMLRRASRNANPETSAGIVRCGNRVRQQSTGCLARDWRWPGCYCAWRCFWLSSSLCGGASVSRLRTVGRPWQLHKVAGSLERRRAGRSFVHIRAHTVFLVIYSPPGNAGKARGAIRPITPLPFSDMWRRR